MSALDFEMPYQLYFSLCNQFEIQLKPAHSLHLHPPQRISASVKTQALENGVFLMSCLVQFPYSRWVGSLDAVTVCTPVKPGYSPPLHTLCLTALTEREAFIHTTFFSEYTTKEQIHTGTQAHKTPPEFAPLIQKIALDLLCFFVKHSNTSKHAVPKGN